ncbi:hypothetical protein GGI26_004556 [Coemansia sp. RSA 1358]|uniref:Cytochrome b5 heme-binding domain-containing protein n=1 Tax=Coemansia umbellata TaxID=1424467 RepID=A0ABQ8PH23_9FUNG|nr:hypothetical protein EDC05_004953 [Coemansia umbellata]KAJ2620950.1 hypothetical protein GGI26_004556 [Coemansia sp. RSA 1358]
MSTYHTPVRPSGDSAATAASSSSVPPFASPFRTPVRAKKEDGLLIRSSSATSEHQRLNQSQQKQAYQPASSLDQTPVRQFTPRGKWFSPEAQRVLDDRASHIGERQSTIRLRWNVASLVVLAWCSQTGVYRQIKVFGLAAGVPSFVWSSLEWFSLAVLAYNIGEAIWYLLQPKKQYTDLAMTPSQRLRVGLDSRAASTAKGVPTSAPRMTPSKPSTKKQTPGPVMDIEARRKTPAKSTRSSTPNGSNTTPRFLRSPVSLAAGTAQHDYSTDSDLLTLTQVLKKMPGNSIITDNNDLGTPTLVRTGDNASLASPLATSILGDPSLATPRLPVGRFGLGDIAAATPMQRHLLSQPTFGLYQTATPASRTSGSEGTKGSSKDRAVGEGDYLEPHEVLEKYGVERDIFDWIENMHFWFVRHLLHPLCKQIDELDSLFEQHGLGHLSCRRAVLDTAALEQAKARTNTGAGFFGSGLSNFPAAGGGFGASGSVAPGTLAATQNPQGMPQDLVELSMRYGDLPQTKERMALERYLLVPGYTCRDYITQRVHTLAQSSALPAYTFDGGGSYIPDSSKGTSAKSGSSSTDQSLERPWSAALHPTDGQLLFHLFCTFMDQTMPPVQNTRHPFTDRYVLQPDRKPDNNLPVQIIQVVRRKPHFCLVVKGSFYDVTANRNNLFIALILFVLEIQRECAGYLGLTNLGGKHVDLISVIGK